MTTAANRVFRMTSIAPIRTAAAADRRRAARGFTLVELLISIALVLVLMTGIVQVFKYAGDAVGTSLAVSELTRSQQALLAQFPADAAGLTQDVVRSPYILLDSQINDASEAPPTVANTLTTLGSMYLDKADAAADAAKAVKYPDFPQIADKQFRFDQFSFLAHGKFTRRTGNDGEYGGNMSSPLARVWYGHLWLPSNDFKADVSNGNTANAPSYLTTDGNSPTYPGLGTAATNPNNYFANQWTLGRVVTLIVPKNYPITGTPTLTDVVNGTQADMVTPHCEAFNDTLNDPATGLPLPGLTPITYGSPFRAEGTPNDISYTLPKPTAAGMGPQNFRYDLAAVRAATGDPFRDYFYPRLDQSQNLNTTNTAIGKNWYESVDPLTPFRTANYRFQSNPNPVRPLDSVKVASATPAMVAGCTQFYVEFAGDFLTQNPTTGNRDPASPVGIVAPDGVTDFYVDATGVRHTRWYGLYRSTSGARQGAAAANPGASFINTTARGDNPDVCPVSTFMQPIGMESVPPLPAYQVKNADSLSAIPARNFPAGSVTFEKIVTATHYVCAWEATPKTSVQDLNPNDNTPLLPRPSQFRLTVVQTDPTGRLGAGRSSQYLIPVADITQ